MSSQPQSPPNGSTDLQTSARTPIRAGDLVLVPSAASAGSLEEAVVAFMFEGSSDDESSVMVCFHDSGEIATVQLRDCKRVVPITVALDESGQLPSVTFENTAGRALDEKARNAHTKECKEMFNKAEISREKRNDLEAGAYFRQGCEMATMYQVHGDA